MKLNGASQTNRFNEHVWPHAASVLRTARVLTGNDADADDLAQDTMLKAFGAIHSLRDGTSGKAWLLAILRNTHIDHLRAAPPRTISLDQPGLEPAAGVRDLESQAGQDYHDCVAVLERFSDAHVITALRSLPKEICWTLLLADVEGLDHREAAKVLGVPVGTVKSRVHRGRLMLRDRLLPAARALGLRRGVSVAARENRGQTGYDAGVPASVPVATRTA